MKTLPTKCEHMNAVGSFCDCIGTEAAVDEAAQAFCARAAEGPGRATGDELVELKKALKDLDEPDPDEGCCEC